MQTDLTQVQAGARKSQHIDYGRVLEELTFGRTSTGVNVVGWVLFGVCLVVFLGQMLKAVDPQDEGQFLTYPWLIAHGWMPYRDIWMSYPPATYLILMPFYKLGVMGLVAERSLGVVAHVLYIVLINRAVTGSWRRLSWLASFTTFSLIFIASDTKPYPWLVALPILLVALLQVQRRPLLASGLFFLAGTFRFEFALAGLVALGVLVVLDRLKLPSVIGRGDPTYIDGSGAKRKVQAVLILTVLVGTFYGGLDLLTSGWAWRDIFVDQIVTVQQGRYVSFLPLPFGPLGLPVLFAMLAGPPLMIVAGLLGRRPDIVATNAAVVVLLPHFFQRVDASHLFSMSALVIPWSIICLASLWRSQRDSWSADVAPDALPDRASRFSRFSLGWLGLTVGAWSSLLVIAYAIYLSPLSPLTSQPPSRFASRVVSGKQTIIGWTVGEAKDDQQVANFFSRHANTRQTVFIVPASLTSSYTRTDFYYLLGLRPAVQYLEVQSGVLTQRSVQRDIIQKLQRCRWIVQLHGGQWYGPTPHASGSILEAYIRSHYQTRMHNVTYAVLERKVGA